MLASGVDGLREVVGGAGVLFEHENPQDLAEKIKRLSESSELYMAVAQACRAKAKSYDIDMMVAAYDRVYNSLCV